MNGDERVRRCAKCQLNVYNLSAMKAGEVRELVEKHEGRRLCVRFFQRADGTVLTADCPVRRLERSRRFAKTWRLALSGFAAAISVGSAVMLYEAENWRLPLDGYEPRQVTGKMRAQEPVRGSTVSAPGNGSVFGNADLTKALAALNHPGSQFGIASHEAKMGGTTDYDPVTMNGKLGTRLDSLALRKKKLFRK